MICTPGFQIPVQNPQPNHTLHCQHGSVAMSTDENIDEGYTVIIQMGYDSRSADPRDKVHGQGLCVMALCCSMSYPGSHTIRLTDPNTNTGGTRFIVL
jgi:hypothetical protein